MNVQKTEWGQIDYFHIPEKNSNQSINIGFAEIGPGKRQPRHIHYGQEQFIYIIEGQGTYIVNGEQKEYKAGMYMYIEPDAAHETINTGKTILREMMISNTVSYDNLIEIKAGVYHEDRPGNVIYEAIEMIRTPVLDTLHLPFTIFDPGGSIAWSSEQYPAYCVHKCKSRDSDTQLWPCLKENILFTHEDAVERYICPYGLTVFELPIVYNSCRIGTIRGGHILLSDSDSVSENNDDIYDTPRSSIIGIQKVLTQIVKSIQSICQFNDSKMELMKKDKQIQLSEQKYFNVNDQVTNLKINHHFLFNTLNSMAEMALTGGKDALYDSIVNLAKMFRYTMAVDLRFVSLASELEYLRTYLDLQKLRFGSSLCVVYEIEEELRKIQVPFNFLQPIVENAFTHGFTNIDGKYHIKIKVSRLKNKAKLCVYNNGSIVSRVTLNRVNKSLSNNNGHGLSFIYEKLKSAYAEDFSMKLKSSKDEGTCVCVVIPILE